MAPERALGPRAPGPRVSLGILGLDARSLRIHGFGKSFDNKMLGLRSLARLGNLGMEARSLRIKLLIRDLMRKL